MGIRHRLSTWIRRQVRGLGSLVAAIMVVTMILSYAMYSMAVPHETPKNDRSVAESSAAAGVRSVVASAFAGLPSLYIKAFADKPVTLTAQIEVHGWKDRGQRIVDAEIADFDAAPMPGAIGKRPVAFPEGQLREELLGQRVLASVSAAAVGSLPESGPAKVDLVVTPAGDTATLVIDRVISGATASTAAIDVSQPNGASRVAGSGIPSYRASAKAPSVYSLSRYWGTPGTMVTMTGADFGATMGKSWVTCNGSKAKIVRWSNNTISFRVPSGMTRQGYVGVVRDGRTSNGMYFCPFVQPVISAVNPRAGGPGTTVVISGRGFGSKQTDGWVSFSGSTAQVVSWADTAIKVVVPRDVTSGYLGVVAHGMASNGVLFAPLGAPLVASVSSTVLLPDRSVTIRGSGFGVRGGSVLVGGVRVPADSWSPSQVVFTVPRGMKAGYVGVQRRDSMTSNGVWVPWAPRVASLSRWWAAPSSELTLRGVEFGATKGRREVRVAGVPATVKSWSDDEITIEVPSGATSGYVGIGGTSASSNGIYLVVETPAVLESVTPRHVASGDTVTVRGANFGSARPTSRVYMGYGVECTVVSWSDTEIVVTAPEVLKTCYVGVIKHGVSSNGVWVTPRIP